MFILASNSDETIFVTFKTAELCAVHSRFCSTWKRTNTRIRRPRPLWGAYHGQWQYRVRNTWMRYCKCIDYLRAFMDKEYRVQDMPLAVLEQSFVEKFHAYLFLDKGLLPGGLICYLKCLKYVVKIAVCLNMWFLNSRNN